jgi:hypothetical protein
MFSSEKHQKSLLGGIKQLCREAYPSLVPLGVPKIIMEIYQANILEEVIKHGVSLRDNNVAQKASTMFSSYSSLQYKYSHTIISILCCV